MLLTDEEGGQTQRALDSVLRTCFGKRAERPTFECGEWPPLRSSRLKFKIWRKFRMLREVRWHRPEADQQKLRLITPFKTLKRIVRTSNKVLAEQKL
jgi:hypothetical protein